MVYAGMHLSDVAELSLTFGMATHDITMYYLCSNYE